MSPQNLDQLSTDQIDEQELSAQERAEALAERLTELTGYRFYTDQLIGFACLLAEQPGMADELTKLGRELSD